MSLNEQPIITQAYATRYINLWVRPRHLTFSTRINFAKKRINFPLMIPELLNHNAKLHFTGMSNVAA